MRETEVLTNILGQRVRVFTNDHIGTKIRVQGLYEKENLFLLRNVLEQLRQPIVLDIGANIGNHSMALAACAAHVHAFEPLPAAFALLDENIHENNLHNVHAHPVALSDEEGDATFYHVRSGNVGASGFDLRHNDAEPVTVQKRIGDRIVRELGLTRVDLIKIDVEAHEAFVLRGLMQTIKQHRPFIVMEWTDPLTIQRFADMGLWKSLFSDYRVFVLGSNYDREYRRGEPLAFLRRKLCRLIKPRSLVLYPFNPARLYKNLLLVPPEKRQYLPEVLRVKEPTSVASSEVACNT